MAINTLDHIIEASTIFPPKVVKFCRQGGLQIGRAFSGWPLAGIPGVGFQNTTINGAVLSQSSAPVPGSIVIPDAPSGKKNYIGRVWGWQATQGNLWICDRLWSNQINRATTSVQTINSPAWPTRDANGSSNGEGVLIGMEVSEFINGAASGTITLGYTDSDGNAGKTALGVNGVANSMGSASVTLFPLNVGEKGVRSIQSVQTSTSWDYGVINLFAYRILYDLPCASSSYGAEALYQDTGLPEIPNGAVPFLMGLVGSTIAGNQQISMQILQR